MARMRTNVCWSQLTYYLFAFQTSKLIIFILLNGTFNFSTLNNSTANKTMIFNRFTLISVILVIFTCAACNSGPKIIPITSEDQVNIPPGNSGIFSDVGDYPSQQLDNDFHTVRVNEVLPTEKYIYLNVTEGKENFWIATLKMDANVGEEYIYKGSVRLTDFKSEEYNRTFEEVYFVSEIIPATHGMEDISKMGSQAQTQEEGKESFQAKNIAVMGSLRIAELVSNPEKYENQVVQISGQCVKLNPEIMGLNWIHLKDGSKDEYDLVLTSDEMVTVGQIVTMKGTVSLDKDFGAGYRYDIIIEGANIVN